MSLEPPDEELLSEEETPEGESVSVGEAEKSSKKKRKKKTPTIRLKKVD